MAPAPIPFLAGVSVNRKGTVAEVVLWPPPVEVESVVEVIEEGLVVELVEDESGPTVLPMAV